MTLSLASIKNILVFLVFLGITLRSAGSTAMILQPALIFVGSSILLLFLSQYQNGPPRRNIIRTYFVFLAYLFLTLIWTPSPSYGSSKVYFLTLFTLFFVVNGAFIAKNFGKTARYFFICNIIFLSLFYVTFGPPWDIISNLSGMSRLKDEETSPLTYARYLGLVSFCTLYILINTKRIIHKVPIFLTLVFSMLYMMLSGSKGPVFSLIIGGLFVLYSSIGGKMSRVIGICIVGLTMYFVVDQFSNENITTFVQGRYIENERSYDSRTALYTLTFTTISNSNFLSLFAGNGSGSFSKLLTGIDERIYPHNLILETIYEFGLIGCFLLFSLTFYPVIANLRRRKRTLETNYLIGLWIYTFLNSLVSGDLSGNFLFIGFSLVLYHNLFITKNVSERAVNFKN